SWLDAALRQAEGVPAALRQRTLREAANLAERQGDLDPARALAEESVELARALDDSDALGAALLELGIIECDASDFDRAEEDQREALNLFATSGNDREARQTLGMLGFLLIARGKYSDAQEVCEEAL